MSSSSLLSFHTRIPLATTLPPPAGFFPPGPWVSTIRSWYINVLSSPLAGWRLPWASITSQVDHLSLQTQDQVSIMTVTYFKYTLTTLCTLAWTTWNFSSLVTITRVLIIYLFECHWSQAGRHSGLLVASTMDWLLQS